MGLLNWMGEHPILAVTMVAFIAAALIHDWIVGTARMLDARYPDYCTCECSKPTTPATAKDKE